MQKTIKYTFIFVLIAIWGVYFSYRTFSSNNIKETSQYSYATTYEIPVMNDTDNFYENVNDNYVCTTILYESTETVRYINIILEDTPKAKNIKEYYKANKTAIDSMFSFSSEKDFEELYEKIKKINRLKSYSIVSNNVNKVSPDRYTYNLKLIGLEEVEIPIMIYMEDKEKYKAKSYWNKED